MIVNLLSTPHICLFVKVSLSFLAYSDYIYNSTSMCKFKYYVKIFLLEKELMITITTNSPIVLFPFDESVTFDFVLNVI